MSQNFISEGKIMLHGKTDDIKKILEKANTDDAAVLSFKEELNNGQFLADGTFAWEIPFDTNDKWALYGLKNLHSNSKKFNIRFILDAKVRNHSCDAFNVLFLDITSKDKWHEPELEPDFEELANIGEQKIDISDLQALYNKWKDIPQGSYTDDSWNDLQDTLEEAERWVDEGNYDCTETQSDIDEMLETLKDTIDNLESDEG